jgi:nucleotide-binding universal stress UspA family protein
VFERILLAVDGSEHSKKAIELVKQLAPQLDSEVIVVHVREKVATRGGVYSAYGEEEESSAERQVLAELEEARARVRAVEASALHGQVGHKIVETAAAVDADVIAMGTRGLGEVAGMFLGSVAHRVLHLAECPVLIAR